MFFWARRPPVRFNGLKDHEAELESYLATKLSEGPKKSTARCHGLVPWSLTISATRQVINAAWMGFASKVRIIVGSGQYRER